MEFYFFPFTLVVLVTCGIFVQCMINFLLMLMIKLLDWKWWIFFLRKKMPHRLGYCCLDLSYPINESGVKFLLIALQHVNELFRLQSWHVLKQKYGNFWQKFYLTILGNIIIFILSLPRSRFKKRSMFIF